jgi:hypothetical protein
MTRRTSVKRHPLADDGRSRRVALVALILVVVVPIAAAQTGGTGATPVVGGGSFNSATALEPGRWADTVVPAETTFYKVRLREGQRMRVGIGVDLSALSDERNDQSINTKLRGLLYRLDVYTPLRQRLALPSSGLLGSEGPDRRTGEAETPAVQPLGRALRGGPEFSGPGDWYIAINVSETLGTVELPIEFPIELEVEVTP